MFTSFKSRLEVLETREAMDAAGAHALYQDIFIPGKPTSALIEKMPPRETSATTGVLKTTSNSAPTLTTGDNRASDYSAVVFVGGWGSSY